MMPITRGIDAYILHTYRKTLQYVLVTKTTRLENTKPRRKIKKMGDRASCFFFILGAAATAVAAVAAD